MLARIRLVTLLTLAAFSGRASASNCVLPGIPEELRFPRPSLGAPGLPTSARWLEATGVPMGWEYDRFSANDPLGMGKPGVGWLENTASITIENQGGNLSGPNGVIQNGGLEGPCIEVMMCWTYTYTGTVEECVSIGIQGQVGGQVGIGEPGVGGQVGGQVGAQLGGSVCVEVEVQLVGTLCSSTEKVCPC